MEFNIGDIVQYNGHRIGYIVGVREEDSTKIYIIEMFDRSSDPIYAIPKFMKKV